MSRPKSPDVRGRTFHHLLAAGLVACAAGSASAQFGVNVLYDAPDFDLADGLVDADPGTPGEQATLRACIQNVNIQPPGSYSILVPAGYYLLSQAGSYEDVAATGDLDIDRSVSIIGAGVAAVTIDGSALGDRLFDIRGAHSVYFNDMTLTGGTTPAGGAVEGGGCIRQAAGGTLEIGNVHITSCAALGGLSAHGGAILAEGSLEVDAGARLEGNRADGHGGAVYLADKGRFFGVVLANNSSQRQGGAVRTAGTSPLAEFLGCEFLSNRAASAGGAINHSGPAEIHDSRFMGNDAIGVGGGVNVFASLSMTKCYFEANHSASGGGAMNITGVTGAMVHDCHFVRNKADTSGGAVTNAAPSEFWHTTFEENHADGAAAAELGGGAIYSFRPLYLINSTLTRNRAPSGLGGAILNLTGGTAELANVTIAENQALQGDSICNGTPGGGASMRLDHTVVSNVPLPTANVVGTSLPLASLGHNLDSDGTSGLAGPGDMLGAPGAPLDPMLAPLAFSGGFGPTHDLLPASPCWDTGDVQSVDPFGNWITDDQRHSGRPVGRVDRGAVEMPTKLCRADYNGDGVVNTIDVLAFLNDWVNGDPRADINGDGAVNTLDVLAFLNLWTQGCP